MIFVFPGQGSQYIGMGKSFYDQFDSSRQVFKEVDDALDQNLFKLISCGDLKDLSKTTNTQPALMATSVAMLAALLKEIGKPIKDLTKYVAGHSLGEYSALCASDVFSAGSAAKLLRIRGNAMQNAVPEGIGSMVALLKVDYNKVYDLLINFPECEISNDNSTEQVVVSGKKSAIESFCKHAKLNGVKRIVELNVSAPFHCKLMQPAADKMQEALDKIKMQDLKIPLISNVTADVAQKKSQVKDLLIKQITHTVRWRETVEYCKKNNINKFLEIGAGSVLTKLIKKTYKDAKVQNLENVCDLDSTVKFINED